MCDMLTNLLRVRESIRAQRWLEHKEASVPLTRESFDDFRADVLAALGAPKECKLYWGKGTVTVADLGSHRLPATLDKMLEQYDADPDAVCVYAFQPTATENSPTKPPAMEESDTVGELPTFVSTKALWHVCVPWTRFQPRTALHRQRPRLCLTAPQRNASAIFC